MERITLRQAGALFALFGLIVCMGTTKGSGSNLPSSGMVTAHGSIDAAVQTDDIYDNGINGGAAPDCNTAAPAGAPSAQNDDPLALWNVRFHDGTVLNGLRIDYYAPSGQTGQLKMYGDPSFDQSPYYGGGSPQNTAAFSNWRAALSSMVPSGHYLRLQPYYENNDNSAPVSLTYSDGSSPMPNEGGQVALGLDQSRGFLSGTHATFYSQGPVIGDVYYNIMLHEFGHALGLLHSPHPNSVMYYKFYSDAPCYTINGSWQTPNPYSSHPVATVYDPGMNCDEDGTCGGGGGSVGGHGGGGRVYLDRASAGGDANQPVRLLMDDKRRADLAAHRKFLSTLNTPQKRIDYYRSLIWIHGPDSDAALSLHSEGLYLASPLVVNARVLGPTRIIGNGIGQMTLYRVHIDAVVKHLFGPEADRQPGQDITVAVPSAYRDAQFIDDPQLQTNTRLVMFLKRTTSKTLARHADRVYEFAVPMVSKWAIYPDGHYRVLSVRRSTVSDEIDHKNAVSLFAAAQARYGLASTRNEEAFTRRLLANRRLGSVEEYSNAMMQRPSSVLRRTLEQDSPHGR